MLATKLDGVLKAVPAQGSPASPSPAATIASKPAASAGAGGTSLEVKGYQCSAIFKSLHGGISDNTTREE